MKLILDASRATENHFACFTLVKRWESLRLAATCVKYLLG
jgi:hypothetical protein